MATRSVTTELGDASCGRWWLVLRSASEAELVCQILRRCFCVQQEAGAHSREEMRHFDCRIGRPILAGRGRGGQHVLELHG